MVSPHDETHLGDTMPLLTDALVRTAIPADGKRIRKLTDGATGTGDGVLQLWVMKPRPKRGRPLKDAPKFVRRWVFDYRHAGGRKRLTLGNYPALSLQDARKKADEHRRSLRDGTDPVARRKADKRAAAVAHLSTFGAVADEWLQKRKPLCSAVTHEKLTWMVGLVRPSLGRMSVGVITPADIVSAFKPIVAAGKLDTARRCRANLSRIFNYAMLHGLCDRDPAAPLARNDEVLPPPIVKHHAAITDRREGDRDGDAEKRFGEVLRVIEGYEGSAIVRNALNLIALIACRPGELRAMRWSWVSKDSITFPAGVMKMRETFEVPLSSQAVALLADQRGMTGWSEYVFPAIAPQSNAKRPNARPISEATLNAGLRRCGYLHDQHVAHGFRSSFSSLANESRLFASDVIEAALAHTVGGVRGVYLRSAFTPERRNLAQWWADRCDELRAGRPSKVVPLRPAAS
jgi:integrase